jgi:putative transposase
MVNSNGKAKQNSRPARQYKQRLKLLHQRANRSEKGKNDRKKACVKLEKIYLKIHNKREDFLHKLSKKIVDENQVICLEDIDVASMLTKTKSDDRNEPRWKEKRKHRNI